MHDMLEQRQITCILFIIFAGRECIKAATATMAKVPIDSLLRMNWLVLTLLLQRVGGSLKQQPTNGEPFRHVARNAI